MYALSDGWKVWSYPDEVVLVSSDDKTQSAIDAADLSGSLSGSGVLAYAQDSYSSGGSLFYDADGNFSSGRIHIADVFTNGFADAAPLSVSNFEIL